MRRSTPIYVPGEIETIPRVSAPATSLTLQFLKSRWISVVVLSALILVPCYWHRRIEAGDLGSHTYNAWLAQLIAHGHAPGLYLAHQWNNVLVDLGLTWLGGWLGFVAAERIVVSLCVLCFFWGAFAFIAASTRRAPWILVPLIAMVAYGFSFYAGFMNYYLSIGLAFWAAAIIWRGTRAEWVLGGVLAVLTFMAHPMGFAMLVGLVSYILLAENVRGIYRWVLPVSALLAICGVHFYLLKFHTIPGLGFHGLLRTGVDQFLLFGPTYKLIAVFVFLLSIVCVVDALMGGTKLFSERERAWTPLTLWALLVVTATMLPAAIWLPPFSLPASSITDRLTSVTAVLGLCVLGAIRPRAWIIGGFAACAVVFFGLQFRDTGALNRMEQEADALVDRLPPGYRVSYTLTLDDDSRINFRHMIDRACIERCFAYSNYEPGSGQFRVRTVRQGSPLVSDSGLALELGQYVVRPADLPMAEIYQPDDTDLTKLSIRILTAGEKNGRLGHRPPASEIESRLHPFRQP